MKPTVKKMAKKFVAKELKKDKKDVQDQTTIMKAVGKKSKAKKVVSKELKSDKNDVTMGETLMGALSGGNSKEKSAKKGKNPFAAKKKGK